MGLELGEDKSRREEMMENILNLLRYMLAKRWLLLVDGVQFWWRRRNNNIVIAVALLS
jgi:hypothetical protein